MGWSLEMDFLHFFDGCLYFFLQHPGYYDYYFFFLLSVLMDFQLAVMLSRDGMFKMTHQIERISDLNLQG